MTATDHIVYSERRIEGGLLQARQAHALRRVPILMPTLCRVRHGEKLLQWGERAMRVGGQHLILMPAGEELGIANFPGAQGYVAEAVRLSPELLTRFRARHGALLENQLAQAASANLCVPLNRDIGLAWHQLIDSLHPDGHAALQEHHAEGLLLALGVAGHAGPLLRDRRDRLSARVQQLLLLDPGRRWSVDEVAARLHLGASTLRRQLAAEERPFRQVSESVRLGVALERLQSTRRPIGEIAVASGYASASRFAVRFRQHYGLSPRALRAAL